jgi:uncharacterized repeat protein (TIGR01451 family)
MTRPRLNRGEWSLPFRVAFQTTCLLAMASAADAQYVQRFSAITNGAVTFTGNTLGLDGETSQNGAGTRGAIDTFITTDTSLQDASPAPTSAPLFPAGTTSDWRLNESRAVLTLPLGARLLRAELVWGGTFAGNAAADNVSAFIDDAIRFTTPSGAFDVTPYPATARSTGTVASTGTCNGCFYARSADVTALVSASGRGTYAVGRVPATQGTTDNSNPSAGWTLAVIYEDFTQPIRSLSLFQGLEKSDGDAAALSGFCTSPTGPVSGRLAVSAVEGDARTTGDDLRFGPTSSLTTANRVSGPRNPPTNFFASQILNDQGDLDTSGTFGTLNHTPNDPVVGGRQGWDISNVNASAQLVNNQTMAFAQGTTSGDAYHIMALALQIDVGAPKFASAATLSVDRATASLGDVLTYSVLLDNTASTADANNVVFFDTPPDGTSFVPDSFAINGTAQPGVSPVTGVPIGTLAAGTTMTVSFQARVDSIPQRPEPQLRANRARWTFDYVSCAGQPPQSGANETNTVVTIVPVADLRITKNALNPAFAGVPVIYQIVVTNAGPSNVDGALVSDSGGTPALTDLTWTCTSPIAGSCTTASGTGPLSSTIFLPAGAATTFRVTGRLPSATPSGTITNTTSVAAPAGVPDLDTTNNAAVLTVPIDRRANLEITKSGPATGSRGTNLVYTMVVRNRGPSDADNVLVTDPTPTGLTLVSLTGPCTAAPGCSLVAGASHTATATFAIPPGYAGPDPIVNVGSVTSATPDPNTSFNTSRATTSLDTPVAAVSLVMTDNVTEVAAGTSTTYTITLMNDGPASAPATRVVDTFNPSFFASAQWQCVASGASTCTAAGSQAGSIDTLVNLDPGSANAIVITVQAQVRPDATGTVENDATVTVAPGVTDPTADDNVATDIDTIRVVADMSLVKTGPSVIIPGTTVDYTIVVANGGPSVARGFQFVELPEEGAPGIGLFRPDLIQSIQLPPDVTCVDIFNTSATGQEFFAPACTVPVLGPSETRTVMVRIRIPPDHPASLDPSVPTAFTNIADAVTLGADDDPDSDDFLGITTATLAPQAEVGVSVVGPAAVQAGTVTSYFIRVSNAGPSRATNVMIANPIPAGLTLRAIDGPCLAFPCTLAALDVGTEINLRVDFNVPLDYAGAETYVNTATARSDVPDQNPANGASSVSTLVLQARVDLRLSKTGPSSVVPGGQLQYDVVVSKATSAIATDVTTIDALPAGTTFVSAAAAGAATTCTGPQVGTVGIVNCTTPIMQAGEEIRIRLIAQADDSLHPGSVLSNVAVVSAPLPDFNNTNDRARVDTVVAAPTEADVSIAKTAVTDVVVVGTDVTYTLTVHNWGPATATNVTLTDVLPASLTLVSATASQGSCAGLQCALGTLPAGEDATVTLVATATAPGAAINEAVVTAAERDPASANNRVSHPSTVGLADQANLLVEIVAGPIVLAPGQSSAYAIHVTNRGPAPALNVQLNGLLPQGLPFLTNVGACMTSFPCDLGDLQPSESRSIGTVFTVPADFPTPTTVTTTVTASGDTPDPDSSNDSASVTATAFASDHADLEVTITDSPDAVTAGGALSYAIVASNRGPATTTGARLTHHLPNGVTNVAVTTNQGTCTGTGPIVCDLPELSTGSYIVVHVLANAPAVPPAPNPMVTTATVTGPAPDPNPANNTAAEPTTVLAVTVPPTLADVAVTLARPVVTSRGGDVIYSIGITNLGPSTALGVQVAGAVPAGLMFVSASALCAGGFPCSVATIAAGATVTIEVTVRVPPTYRAPTIVNSVTVATTTPDPVAGNNTASATTGVLSGSLCNIAGGGLPTFVTGAGPGGGPHVRVWSNGAIPSVLNTGYYAYDPAFAGGVSVACGDINGDGIGDMITGAGPGGGPHARVFDFAANQFVELVGFFAYDADFTGGVNVAAGDITGDGVDEVITGAGPGGGPHVRFWSYQNGGLGELADLGFFAYDAAFAGGVNVSAGDVNGDGATEVVTGAGPGGGPHVRVWTNAGGVPSELGGSGFFAYDAAFAGGVSVAVGDIDGDGVAEIVTGAGPGGGPHVRVWNLMPAATGGTGAVAGDFTERAGFFAYDASFTGGVHVGTADIDGDGVVEILTGAGPGGGPHVRIWRVVGTAVVEVFGFYAYNPAFTGGVFVGR